MDSGKTVSRRSIIQMTGAALVLPAVPVSAQDLEKRRMFTPTFIDLVRNYTKTSGVGDFVLGTAVSGYRSFADAVKTGDSFYYSATGIDKPEEFEVGRGTMQSDGTIKREPLGGIATDFGTGFKAVALVAAAEWYQAIHAGTAGAPISAASRDSLAALADTAKAALLHEPRREGVFTFAAADLSAEVGSDITRAIYVPPASDPSGSSGAWVRRFEGPLHAGWFGAEGDGIADDAGAMQQALTFAGSADGKHVVVPAGTYRISKPLVVPNGVVFEGSGANSALVSANGGAGQPWVFNVTSGADFTIRNIKMTPDNSGDLHRAAVFLNLCRNVRVENVIVEGQTDATGVYLWDCDSCVVDGLYFDGGAAKKAGYGVYMGGCKGCKAVNSTAINCSQGFGISGQDTDQTLTRTTAECFGNSIADCYVRWCTSHSFNINSSTYNTVSNCHAEDYAGSSTHKAFQSKHPSGDDARGNVFIGCTAKNYPSGFGAQQSYHAQFIGCTARDVSLHGFEFVSASGAQVVGCAVHEFGEAGIYTNSGTTDSHFDNINLETSTATAKGIVLASAGGTDSNNNFDSITTRSRLAAFIDIAAGARNNRFGSGCRPNGNVIVDSSTSTTWPMVVRTESMALDSVGTKFGSYSNVGMQVAVARFVVTGSVGGAPAVSAGRLGAENAIAAPQPVSGAAGTAASLTLASQALAPGSILSGTVTTAGSGAGYVQFEGLPA